MTDIAELHDRALDAAGRVVAGIAPDRWHAETRCAGWDVRALLSHLVAGSLRAAGLAGGGTIEGAGGRLDGDLLGCEPAESHGAPAGAAAVVFYRPGALGAPCAVSCGPVPGSVYAGHRFIDVLIQGWDLAVATGQDRKLAADLVSACLEIAEPQAELLRSGGAFAGEVAVAADATAQARLLAMLGREA